MVSTSKRVVMCYRPTLGAVQPSFILVGAIVMCGQIAKSETLKAKCVGQ